MNEAKLRPLSWVGPFCSSLGVAGIHFGFPATPCVLLMGAGFIMAVAYLIASFRRD